jgi:multimeric flavodoxin WrbA
MTKILAVSGSPRSGGNTDCLLDEFVKGAAEAGAKTETIYLRDYNIYYCAGCEECQGRGSCARYDDGMSLIYPKIDESMGLILGSPVHNYNVSALMKTFVDRLFPYYIFTKDKPRKFSSKLAGQGRQAAVFAVGEQKSLRDMCLALPAMTLPLEALGYKILHEANFRGFLSKGVVSADKTSLKSARESGFQLGSAACLAKGEELPGLVYLRLGALWRFPYV